MSSRKRSGSGSKRPKEKVVYIYEMIFKSDFEDPTKTNAEFWQEFFLLQPNVECLESEMTKLSCELLIQLKENINLLFCRCIEMLESGWWTLDKSFRLPLKIFGWIVTVCLQIIQSVCATACKHYVRYSMRSFGVMPAKRASMWSAPFSILLKLKRKWKHSSPNATIW